MNRYLLFASLSVMIGMVAVGFSRPSRGASSASLVGAATPGAGIVRSSGVKTGFAVVELFTSEGCSSCPPADAALAKIAREYPANVYVLGFHVDYWDRLGWKDVYSSSDYTHRQQEYAQLFNLNSIYTPEAVVNGQREFVGSNESSLRSAVEEGLAGTSTGAVTLAAKPAADGKNIKVSYTVDDPGKAVLQVALVQSMAASQVLRGENQGLRLQHINVVRGFETVSLKGGNSGMVSLPVPEGLGAKDCKVIGFLQGKDGKIVAASGVGVE